MKIMNAPWWARLQMMLYYCGVVICDPVFQHSEMQKIIQSKEKFDVFIVEIFSTECFLGIAHTLDIPVVVGMISSVAVPWSNDIMRNPEIPSYIPNYLSGLTDKMNFFQRIQNTWHFLYTKTFYRYFSDKPSYKIAKKYLSDNLPDFDWLRSKISLILANGHLTISPPRALAPGFKDVGGIHIPLSGPPPLPKDLQNYLDNQREDGVIYFSLGSQLDGTTMPEQVLVAFYRAFEQLPQQILWKCTEEKMPTLPRNVKCIEWAPQLSILCHPNVRMFITHGGLLGTQEAVYCGVPMLGIPLFGDQHSNVAYSVKKGLALELDYYGLSYETISSALNEMLKNKSYGEVAQRASLQFRDRPIPPVEEGVYWIEYLIRHGPDSLKIEAANLTWYQYLLLDIVCVITADDCSYVWQVPAQNRCEWVKTIHDCNTDSVFQYTELLFCTFNSDNKLLFSVGLMPMVLWLLYMFLMLGTTADNL
ncbi:UDP-glucuronosyltransferase 2C1 [Dufourea novaeangliae]|uniref:UDP-glucuronosyltransferase 2C1 n=1 Tax=Dufourea novaeangliae TaxID=178035 RepID=A0A154PR11_DUFNO|nr:UDP-glucuronosyltransferase 2C1 [Dufourea novaeangliae]